MQTMTITANNDSMTVCVCVRVCVRAFIIILQHDAHRSTESCFQCISGLTVCHTDKLSMRLTETP